MSESHLKERLPAIDALRLFSAFGVVLIHLAPSKPAGEVLGQFMLLFCVPYFAVISLYFLVPKALDASRPWRSLIAFDRILVPYACWSTIYLGLRFAKATVAGQPLALDWIGVVFFGGAAVQLYFLPWLIYLQLLLVATLRIVRPGKFSQSQPFALLALTACLVYAYFHSRSNPVEIWPFLYRSVFYVGFAVALWALAPKPVFKKYGLLVGLILFAIFEGMYFVDFYPVPDPDTMLLCGYAVAIIALSLPQWQTPTWLQQPLSTYYGIYLTHFGFIEAFEYLAAKLGHDPAPYSLFSKLLIGVLVFGASLAFTLLIRRNPLAAYLLLGEGWSPWGRKGRNRSPVKP